MIELITGLPGNGKTLYTISEVKARAEKENRPVFYHGIPELKLDWESLDDPREWAKVPPGAIVVLDEAQKTFRNRSMGSTPPEFVQQLETHRHLGIDLVLITQHPSLIDPAVRRLAGRHQHLVRPYGLQYSTVHSWSSVKDNCDKSRADSEKKKWVFDKSVYSLYKSAEVHTVKRSIPGRVKMLGILGLVFVAIAWYVVNFVSKKVTASDASVAAVVPAPGSSAPAVSGAMQPPMYTSGTGRDAVDPVADLNDYVWKETPRVSGLPHTAPKYDQATTPTRVPVPAMCIQIGTPASGRELQCKCYTQQATPMDTPFNMCMEFARNGYFQDFDAERDRAQVAHAEAGQAILSDRPDSPRPEREHGRGGPAVVAFADVPERPVNPVRVTGSTVLGR